MGDVVVNQLNLVVHDMEASLAFYRRVGLDIPADAARASGGHHAEVTLANGFVLEFDSPALAHAYAHPGLGPAALGGVIGFALPTREAVDALYAELSGAGYAGQREPYDTFWGARYAIVADPDGHPVGLMSPLDPARRSAPPPLT